MIPHKEKRTFETFTNTPEKETQKSSFQVKLTRETFKALSSGLYSNKIKAVVREYSANATDAHNEVNKHDTPIVVHLPTMIEPYFSVTDKGIGLTDDEVTELFTTYFGSNKRNSNNTTGMLGLGSKSAFAYTDQFTVVTSKEGTRRVYNLFMSEEGFPECTLEDTQTDSFNASGTTVKFAVNSKDFNAFADEAIDIYRYYAVKPVFAGNKITIEEDTREVIKEINIGKEITVKIYSYSSRRYTYGRSRVNETCTIIQGATAYKLDYSSLEGYNGELDILMSNMDIVVPIGACSVTLSREHLEFDKQTVAFLKRLSSEIVAKLSEEIDTDLSKIATKWDAFKYINDTICRLPIYDNIKNTLLWKGTPIDDIVSNKGIKVSLREPTSKGATTSMGYATIEHISQSNINRYKRFRFDSDRFSSRGEQVFKVNPKAIIVVDTEGVKRFNDVLSYNFKEKNYDPDGINCLYFIRPDEGAHAKTWKKINKELKGATIIRFKDLKVPPKDTTSANTNTKAALLAIEAYSSWCWSEPQKVLSEGGFYVPVSNRNPDANITFSGLRELRSDAALLGLIGDSDVVYGVPKSRKNIPTKYKGWNNFYTFLKDKIKEELKGADLKALIELEQNKDFIREHSGDIGTFNNYKGIRHDINVLLKETDLLKNKGVDKELKLTRMLDYLDNQVLSPKETLKSTSTVLPQKDTPFELKWKVLLKKYPLIGDFGVTYKTDSNLIDYIKLVNNQK